MSWSEIAIVVVVVLAVIGWMLGVSASRLDRLHRKVMASRVALDAQLVRRATMSIELATSGELDPASSMLLAEAAYTVINDDAGRDLAQSVPELAEAVPGLLAVVPPRLESVPGGTIESASLAHDESAVVLTGPVSELSRPPERRLLGGMTEERAHAESVLSATLRAALDEPEEIEELVATPLGAELLHTLAATWYRAQLARRFHNEAVAQAVRVRAKWHVRVFHLAGNAPLPTAVDFDDSWPPALMVAAAQRH